MTNIDRAAEVVYNSLNGKYGDFGHHEEVAKALADAGLLAPDPQIIRTLADELRAFESRGHWDSEQLDSLADRVETLEQERDELTYAREEGRAAADNWTNTARRLEEAQAEIDRLRDRDNDDSPTPEPGHPTHLKTEEDYQNAPIGTIVQMEVPGWAHFIKDNEGCWATKGFIGYYTSESMSGTPCVVVEWGTEPVETPEPDHIDPTTCGTRQWYNVRLKSDGIIYDAVRINGEGMIRPWLILGDQYRAASDTDLTVLRPLTSEEMDAR